MDRRCFGGGLRRRCLCLGDLPGFQLRAQAACRELRLVCHVLPGCREIQFAGASPMRYTGAADVRSRTVVGRLSAVSELCGLSAALPGGLSVAAGFSLTYGLLISRYRVLRFLVLLLDVGYGSVGVCASALIERAVVVTVSPQSSRCLILSGVDGCHAVKVCPSGCRRGGLGGRAEILIGILRPLVELRSFFLESLAVFLHRLIHPGFCVFCMLFFLFSQKVSVCCHVSPIWSIFL